MVDFKITEKVFAVCQLKKVLILSQRDLVSQLYSIFKRYLHKR